MKKIKEISPSTGVIMVTALDEHAVAVESMKRGAYDFVTKPIDLNHLELLISVKLLQMSTEEE